VTGYRPFCSKRCADIDLGRWLKEGYRVPIDEGPGEDEPGSGRGPTGRKADASYTARRQPKRRAQVAQLVEHATENRSVGGSIPPLGTIS
jgi:hypothetical protein